MWLITKRLLRLCQSQIQSFLQRFYEFNVDPSLPIIDNLAPQWCISATHIVGIIKCYDTFLKIYQIQDHSRMCVECKQSSKRKRQNY